MAKWRQLNKSLVSSNCVASRLRHSLVLACLQKRWNASAYAFYRPEVTIETVNGRRAHVFHCAGIGCKKSIRRFLDGPDRTSTRNLRGHVKVCPSWGPEVLAAAEDSSVLETREALKKGIRSGNITLAFERKGKGKVTYSTRQHTTQEAR